MGDSRFHDGKEADALRTIGEVADATGIKPHVLRYWEQQFPMLKPLKRSGGRRYYRAEDIALIDAIDDLVNKQGFTLKGAKKALRQGSAATGGAAEPASAEIAPEHRLQAADVLPQLLQIRRKLADALSA